MTDIRQVDLDGARLAVHESGSGPVLLFVHGFPLDHTMWRPLWERLPSGIRVIAPDLRGFGASSGGEQTLTMGRFADDLARLLDRLNVSQPVTFCGLSMGGYIAWEFWHRYPARVRRLVLCDTRAAADSPEAAANRQATAERVVAEGTEFLADTMSEKLFSHKTRADNPDLIQQTRQVMLGTPAETVAAALRGMAQRQDFTARLPEVRVPTLLVCGADDVITPASEMRAMAAAMPRATYTEIAGAGHMAPLERPDVVEAALRDFLA